MRNGSRQRTRPVRQRWWWGGVWLFLLVLLSSVVEARWGEQFLAWVRHWQETDGGKEALNFSAVVPSHPITRLENSAAVPNEEEKKIREKLSFVSCLDGVYAEYGPDRKYILAATAEIGDAEGKKASLMAQNVIWQYFRAVYALPYPVAEGVIYVSQHGRLMAGAALGESPAKDWAQSTAAGGVAPVAEFISFLRDQEQLGGDAGREKWYAEYPF